MKIDVNWRSLSHFVRKIVLIQLMRHNFVPSCPLPVPVMWSKCDWLQHIKHLDMVTTWYMPPSLSVDNICYKVVDSCWKGLRLWCMADWNGSEYQCVHITNWQAFLISMIRADFEKHQLLPTHSLLIFLERQIAISNSIENVTEKANKALHWLVKTEVWKAVICVKQGYVVCCDMWF